MSAIKKRLLKRALKMIRESPTLREYTIRDITFKGEEDLFVKGSTYQASNGHTLDPRVAVPKKLMRMMPQLLGLPTTYFNIVGLPKLTHPVCHILQTIGQQQVERRKMSEKQIQDILIAADKAGVEGMHVEYNAKHVIEFTKWLFDMATISAEADPYYRSWLMDMIINVWQTGEESRLRLDSDCKKCTKGGRVAGRSSWIDDLLDEQNAAAVDMMEGYIQRMPGGEGVTLGDIDQETAEVPVSKKEEAEA